MLLKVTKAAKFFGPKLVFKDVSLELKSGAILLLAGPNGAGKTTLLKLLAGLGKPSAGKVECFAEAGKIGLLGHQTFIYPQLNGLENLRFWAGYYEKRLRDADLLAALERMGLQAAAQERAGRYSRGMLQRLALARVLLLEPDLLLLDEPDTGLDQTSAAILHQELLTAKERGAGLVWISHHLSRDLPKADRVLELRDHRQAYYGPAAEYSQEGSC